MPWECVNLLGIQILLGTFGIFSSNFSPALPDAGGREGDGGNTSSDALHEMCNDAQLVIHFPDTRRVSGVSELGQYDDERHESPGLS